VDLVRALGVGRADVVRARPPIRPLSPRGRAFSALCRHLSASGSTSPDAIATRVSSSTCTSVSGARNVASRPASSCVSARSSRVRRRKGSMRSLASAFVSKSRHRAAPIPSTSTDPQPTSVHPRDALGDDPGPVLVADPHVVVLGEEADRRRDARVGERRARGCRGARGRPRRGRCGAEAGADRRPRSARARPTSTGRRRASRVRRTRGTAARASRRRPQGPATSRATPPPW
jgi:hypothetical protein